MASHITEDVRRKLNRLNEIQETGPLVDAPDYLRNLLTQARAELIHWGRMQPGTREKIKAELLRRKEPIDDLLEHLDLL